MPYTVSNKSMPLFMLSCEKVAQMIKSYILTSDKTLFRIQCFWNLKFLIFKTISLLYIWIYISLARKCVCVRVCV